MAYAKAIELNSDDVEYLQSLVRTRTIQAQVVDRAKMLLYKAQGESNRNIATRLDVNINTVKLCLSKFKEGGVQRALFDDQRKGRPVEITDNAVAWIIDVACQRPADLGYSQELWTLKNLHQHIQNHAEEAGFPRLKTITKPIQIHRCSMIQSAILKLNIRHIKVMCIIIIQPIVIIPCSQFSLFFRSFVPAPYVIALFINAISLHLSSYLRYGVLHSIDGTLFGNIFLFKIPLPLR